MSRYDYESDLTGGREETAAVLSGVVDGVLAGSIRLGEDEAALSVAAPEEIDLEVELEAEDDEVELELELEWSAPDEEVVAPEVDDAQGPDGPVTSGDTPREDEPSTTGEPTGPDEEGSAGGEEESLVRGCEEFAAPVGAADASGSLARFEVYRDRAEEWRWRLRHRNGNILATSGEGYTRKHNAQKGLRSVVRNAPDAEVTEGL